MFLEGLRQNGILCRRGRPVELLLHRLVHPLAMLNPMVLCRSQLDNTDFFIGELVDEEHFVVVVFALVPRQVHLVLPDSAIV
jgi:hypothetical protein